ncbi:pre-mRNA 3' end processing protein WDR33 [Zancudomyces culisetae]|uniref:Polyadenylation factor subunit 2 n=1 Tax=Zancudomyces culisetae TaxID=1213189 RepID=A0A1R1PT15_ZANCU|nr:pre-mRNA 3' end processing protein WDR33 [Zancudomyces culisetae]|eukprot:OMH84032.1 pre-mRNA 3' end processing protein WDR33 [Zancudomyces culisetae]
MDELKSFRGIPKEVTTIEWHPVYETLFASGGSDGAVMIWDTNHKDHLHSIPNAHDSYVWSVTWHPLGHLLATGSNDHTTKFWTRARPGDELESTEFGIPAPLPPGAMNASSLMHGSCSAYKTQGHTAGGQNATTTSEGVNPLSFLQNGQKNMPPAQSQPAPPLVGSSKGPTDSFLRNIPNFQGSNKNTTRGGERTGNYGYSAAPNKVGYNNRISPSPTNHFPGQDRGGDSSFYPPGLSGAAPNKVGYNNRISPSPTNHFPGQDRGGDSSFYPPGLSGSGRTGDSVGRSTQDFPNSDRKARDASSRVPTQQSRPPSRPPVLGGIPGLGASNTQFSTNPSKSRSQNK